MQIGGLIMLKSSLRGKWVEKLCSMSAISISFMSHIGHWIITDYNVVRNQFVEPRFLSDNMLTNSSLRMET